MLKSRQPVWRGRVIAPPEGLFCNFSGRTCMRNRVDGYELCVRHILDDKNCPFKQCQYVSTKSGRRCPYAAPKSDKKDGYCWEHTTRVSFQRQRAMRRKRPRDTPDSIFDELAQYVPLPTDSHGDSGVRKRASITNNLSSKVLEYASSSDSEAEAPLVEQVWKGDAESDCDSIDSDQDDPLKHAGVYTAEEVALIMRDKLIRLQSLYIDQFRRLQYIMREKRRTYLHDVKQERETLCGLSAYKSDPENRDKYNKLQALKRYHKRHGREALLHRRCRERRISMSDGVNYRSPHYQKCVYGVPGCGRCNERSVPLSKYCMTHILHDPHQVLFQGCSFADGTCNEPVPAITDIITCAHHQLLFEQVLSEDTMPLIDTSQYQQNLLDEEVTESMDVDESIGLDTILITSSEDRHMDTIPSPTCGGDATMNIMPLTWTDDDLPVETDAQTSAEDAVIGSVPHNCDDDEVMNTLPTSFTDDSPLSTIYPTCAGDGQVIMIHPTCAGDGPENAINPSSTHDTPVSSIHPTCTADTPVSIIHPTFSDDVPVSIIHPTCAGNVPEIEQLPHNRGLVDRLMSAPRTNHDYAAVIELTDKPLITTTEGADGTLATPPPPRIPASPPPTTTTIISLTVNSSTEGIPAAARSLLTNTTINTSEPMFNVSARDHSYQNIPPGTITNGSHHSYQNITPDTITNGSHHSYQNITPDTITNGSHTVSHVVRVQGLINTHSTSASNSVATEDATHIDSTDNATDSDYRHDDADSVTATSAEIDESYQSVSHNGSCSNTSTSTFINYTNTHTVLTNESNNSNNNLNLTSNLSNNQEMLSLPADGALANLHLLAEISSVPAAGRSIISSSRIGSSSASGISRQISNEAGVEQGEISASCTSENT